MRPLRSHPIKVITAKNFLPKNLTISKEKNFFCHPKGIKKNGRFRRSDKLCKLKYTEKIKPETKVTN